MAGVEVNGVAHLPSHSASRSCRYTYLPGLNMFEMRVVGSNEFTRSLVDTTWLAAERKAVENAARGTTTLDHAARGSTGASDSAEHWKQIDLNRVSPRTPVALLTLADPDLTGATALLGGIQTATRNGPTIAGTLDPTKVQSPITAFEPAQPQATTLVTFTATLDDQGRLARLVIDLPDTPDLKRPVGQLTLNVANYGTATPQAAPADFVSTLDESYQFM